MDALALLTPQLGFLGAACRFTAVSAFCDFRVFEFSSQPTTFSGFHTAPFTVKLTSGKDPGPGCPMLLGKRRETLRSGVTAPSLSPSALIQKLCNKYKYHFLDLTV